MIIKTIQRFITLLILTCATYAQDIEIISLSHNGNITWSNSVSEGYCTVEWGSSLTGQWSSSWQDLSRLPVTNEIMSANVPMFYRVLWTTNNVGDIINANQSIGTGDGFSANFSGVLSNIPIVVGSVTVTDGSGQSLTDNGSGSLTGDGTGSINYATGAITASFTFAPSTGQNVSVSYNYYYSNGIPNTNSSPQAISASQSIGTGDGLTANFSGILSNTIIVKNSVIVTTGALTLTDNGSGTLVGNGTGDVNYQTGNITASFNNAPSLGENIVVSYHYYTGDMSSFVESIGVGNGTEPNIYGTLINTPAMHNSIHITAGDKSFWDDGNGALVGDGFGTVNYDTGEIWVGFSNAPSTGVNIFAEYYYWPAD